MTIYVWRTGHQINETLSAALHAGIPESILKHTEWADNYIGSTNKHVAVGYGILRGIGDVFRHNQANNVDFYEVDRGYINPGHFDGYYRISKNGMQAKYVDRDLPSDRLDRLKFKRENWFNPKGKVIVCPPSEYIESYYGINWDWIGSVVRHLTDCMLPFKIRSKGDTAPLEHDLQGCAAVLTFNSNVAIDATIKGIPVIADDCSVVKKWNNYKPSNLMFGNLEQPTDEQVDRLLRFISYNQFTLKEIRNGTAWRLLHE